MIEETRKKPDFSGTIQPDRIERVRRRRRRTENKTFRWIRKNVKFSIIFIAILAVIAAFASVQLILLTDAANRLLNSQDSFTRVASSLTQKGGTELTLADYNRLEASLVDLSRSLGTVQSRTEYLERFSGVNGDVEAYFTLLDASQQLTNAGRDMLSGLEPTIFFLVEGQADQTVVTQLSSGQRIVELLTLGRGRFLRAENGLTAAGNLLDQIDVNAVSADTLLQVEEIQTFHQTLTEINRILIESPDILADALGFTEEKAYLVLAQNSDELRPAGGYISTWGWLTVRNGRVTDFEYSALRADSPMPPPPSVDINEVYPIPSYWFNFDNPVYAAWDQNWHADFPTTAEMATWFYNNGDNPHTPVDGVIAINLVGFEYILRGLGSVTVPDYGVTVNPGNFRDIVYDIRAFGAGPEPHKDFVAEVYGAIFENWQSLNRNANISGDVLGQTLQALQEKHVMLYIPDEETTQAIELLGWSGAQTPATDHDYLMVVDTNLGNKSNRSVIRYWTHDVQIREDGSLQNRTTITYDYPASVAALDPAVDENFHGPLRYGNLLQVFTPLGSVPLRTQEADDTIRSFEVVDVENHTNFIAAFNVDFDDVAIVQLEYETPQLVEDFGAYKRYRLLLQKQPGTIREQVTAQITLPPGVSIVDTSPAPAAEYSLDQTTLDFRLTLETDQWIEIIYR